MNNFLIPLLHRGISTSSTDNVLWNAGNVYIMDNHRLALWCWFQVMNNGQRYNLLHIDAHPDMSEAALQHFDHDLNNIKLDDYRNAIQKDINTPLFRWDNYIEVFLQKYPELVGLTVSATHHLGSSKELSREIKPYDLVKYTQNLFGEVSFVNDLPWIVNVDLDYFYSAGPEKIELFSDEYVKCLSNAIQKGLANKMIAVLTISLSPECCGSWEKAEVMLKKFGYSF